MITHQSRVSIHEYTKRKLEVYHFKTTKASKESSKDLQSDKNPTVEDLKTMIQMDLIKNNVVTTDDINLATKSYGPGVG